MPSILSKTACFLLAATFGEQAKASASAANNGKKMGSKNLRQTNINDNNKDLETKIVGGVPVSSNSEYPYYVHWPIGCGGSLISPSVVLSKYLNLSLPMRSVKLHAAAYPILPLRRELNS